MGKHGQEISEGSAVAAVLLFAVIGACMAGAARLGFSPEAAGDAGPTIDRLLLWAPAAALMALLWWLDVP